MSAAEKHGVRAQGCMVAGSRESGRRSGKGGDHHYILEQSFESLSDLIDKIVKRVILQIGYYLGMLPVYQVPYEELYIHFLILSS